MHETGDRPRRVLAPTWLDRNLRLLFAARAAMSGARAIAGVVTALYLAAEGYSGLRIGVLFVGVTVASALLSTAIGLWSDRVGRKGFLVAMPLLAAAAAVTFATVRTPAALFVAAAAGSFGRGAGAGGGTVGPYQPAESAIVADSVGGEHRAAAFGGVSFASAIGALVGGLLVTLVRVRPHLGAAAVTAAYRPAFVAAAGLAAAAGLLALGLREPRRPSGATPRGHLRWPRRSWPALWRFWVTNSINGAGIGLFGPFVSYWLHRRYGVAPGPIGVLFALVNVGSLVSTLSAAGIARRVGTVRAIVTVRATTGLLIVPMVLAPSFWAAGGVFILRMLVQRVGLPLRQSFTQDLAHPEERASVAALSNLPAQATMAGTQALAGYLFDEVALALPFVLAAAFQCANAFAYGWLFGARAPGTVGVVDHRRQ
jgi:MFS family permease